MSKDLFHQCEHVFEGKRCTNRASCAICKHCLRDCPVHRNLTPRILAHLEELKNQDLGEKVTGGRGDIGAGL